MRFSETTKLLGIFLLIAALAALLTWHFRPGLDARLEELERRVERLEERVGV